MTRRWWVRLALVSGATALAVILGVVFYRTFFAGPERDLANGETAILAGQKAAHARQWDDAKARYTEAAELADKVLEAAKPKEGEEPTDKHRFLTGKGQWLKARAIYYRYMADQKRELPGAKADGTTTRLDVVGVHDAQIRRECSESLSIAASLLTNDELVQGECLRNAFEAGPESWHWQTVVGLAKNVLGLDPPTRDKDSLSRAHIVLANEAFLQPQQSGISRDERGTPTPALSRKRDLMLPGLDEIAKLRGVESPLRYRSLYLEAQMHRWLAQSYRRSAPFNPKEADRHEKHLRSLLFDPREGSVARVRKERQAGDPAALSRLDLEGLFGLEQIALEVLREDARRPNASGKAEADQAAGILDDLRAVTATVIAKCSEERLPRVLIAAEGLALAARPALTVLVATAEHGKSWRGTLGEIEKLAADALERGKTLTLVKPDVFVAVAELLLEDAVHARDQARDPARQKESAGAAEKWVQRGLDYFAKQKASAAVTQPLRSLQSRIRGATP